MKPLWWIAAVALAALIAAPAITRLAGALVPLAVVLGLVIAGLRIVWFYTR